MFLAPTDIDLKKIELIMEFRHKIMLENNLAIYLYELEEKLNAIFLDESKENINAFFVSKLPEGALETYTHKWRYAEVTQGIESKFLFHFLDKNIILAGDYFGSKGFESSLESARMILTKLKQS